METLSHVVEIRFKPTFISSLARAAKIPTRVRPTLSGVFGLQKIAPFCYYISKGRKLLQRVSR